MASPPVLNPPPAGTLALVIRALSNVVESAVPFEGSRLGVGLFAVTGV